MTRVPGDATPRFVANLKAARKAIGLTQAQIGARMRDRGFPWSQSSVNKAESALRRLRLDEIEALSAIVCVPLGRMVDETPTSIAQIAKSNMRRPVAV
jgi:transcriptional regulator with XRE-family HTH domain